MMPTNSSPATRLELLDGRDIAYGVRVFHDLDASAILSLLRPHRSFNKCIVLLVIFEVSFQFGQLIIKQASACCRCVQTFTL